jgi:hypothetical protein
MRRRFSGLILDWAGVLTTNMVEVFGSFEEREGLPKGLFLSKWADSRGQDLYRRLELGEITQQDWNEGFGTLLGISSENLMERVLYDMFPAYDVMPVAREARAAGVRVAVLSNSLGREFVAVILMYYTGMRWGELVGLETRFVRPAPGWSGSNGSSTNSKVKGSSAARPRTTPAGMPTCLTGCPRSSPATLPGRFPGRVTATASATCSAAGGPVRVPGVPARTGAAPGSATGSSSQPHQAGTRRKHRSPGGLSRSLLIRGQAGHCADAITPDAPRRAGCLSPAGLPPMGYATRTRA